MSGSAQRVESAGSLSPALLPRVTLGLQRDMAPDLELVGVALGNPREVLGVLTESELSPRAVPKRRAEFAAGRHASALALARLGCTEAVRRARNGAPLWPTGFTGSISHGAGIAVSVAGHSRDYRSLGVDVEGWIADDQYAELVDRILSSAELELLAQALPGLTRVGRLSLGFSIKESLYKCLNPIADEFIEFADASLVRVLPRTPSSGKIWLSLRRSFTGELSSGMEVAGNYALGPERVETLVGLRWRRS